jgi:hypothetical protein
MPHERLLATDSHLPLLAPVASALLNAAAKIREQLTWTPSSRHLISRFLALLAMCTNYAFFCIRKSRVRCVTQDLTVDRPSGQTWLFISKAKGD